MSIARANSSRSSSPSKPAKSPARLPGQTPGGIFSTQTITVEPRSVIGQGLQGFRQGRASRVEFDRFGQAAGMDDQTKTAGFEEPVEATFEILDALPSNGFVEVPQIDALGLDRSTSPRSVSAPNDFPLGVDAFSECDGVGKPPPIGEDLQVGCAQPIGDFQIDVEMAAIKSVSDHCSKRASNRHGEKFRRRRLVFVDYKTLWFRLVVYND